MRALRVVLGLFVFLTASAAEPPPAQEMAPYEVNEKPYGFLGIKHATVGLNPLKLVVGMNAIRFFQIDELEPGSPGIAAGVLPGDRISSIDGVPITQFGIRKLKRMGETVEVGQKIAVEVVRPIDGSIRVMEVVVSKKPKPKEGS